MDTKHGFFEKLKKASSLSEATDLKSLDTYESVTIRKNNLQNYLLMHQKQAPKLSEYHDKNYVPADNQLEFFRNKTEEKLDMTYYSDIEDYD